MPKIIVVIVIFALIGFGSYYYLSTKNTPQPTPTPTISPTSSSKPTPSPSSTPQITPSASPISVKPELLNNIKDAVSSKNTAALEGYMTDTVSVIIEATECCGNITKVEAIQQMDYLSSATPPWNFDVDNLIALQLKQKNPQAFPEGVIIGTSADRRLVAFTLNPDKTKIEKLYMAADYKLQGI